MANIFICGGCVMRDTFNLMPEHSLVDYVARQSLISSATPAATTLGEANLESGFQRKSLLGDIQSTLFQSLRGRSSRIDLIMMDTLSDRLGVFQLKDGTYVTNSTELKKSGLMNKVPKRLISFGTDEHFDLWKTAVSKLEETLEKKSLTNKMLVFETPWAELMENGEPATRFRGISSSEGNTMYSRYYSHLKTRGINVETIPNELIVSSSDHKWGSAPYHYTEPAYSWMRDVVQRKLQNM